MTSGEQSILLIAFSDGFGFCATQAQKSEAARFVLAAFLAFTARKFVLDPRSMFAHAPKEVDPQCAADTGERDLH
jgi:hypothetical protein